MHMFGAALVQEPRKLALFWHLQVGEVQHNGGRVLCVP
jgi:hypothetical protein